MNKLTLGSLFDGSGGFPLGGLISGIQPVWASEIEPFPIRVTTKRMPFMKHYGDISQMDGGKIEPVDIITFGSPCTDMSVAGRRAGLDGRQSVLFYQAIRIIKEMRCATNGRYPRYCVWENVPGAFSSNGGEDFKAVLEAVINVAEPEAQVSMPEKNRWPYADCYMGDGWSVAYRVLDAQYWGVPQRRKRIYLVADFTGRSAFDILFKSEGLSGYSAEGFRAWQRTAGNAADCAGTAGICLNDQGGQRMDVTDDVSATLRAEAHHPPCVMESAGFCAEHSSTSRSIGYEEECSPTLRAGTVPAAVYENHSQDTRYTGPLEIAPTVSSTYGMGGNNQPFVVAEDETQYRLTAYGIAGEEQPTLEVPLGSRLLKKGMSGADVKALQELLMQLGYDLTKYGADGKYGPETEAAVLDFQKDQEIVQDGKYGSETHAALMDAVADNDEGNCDEPETNPMPETHRPAGTMVVIISEGGKVNIRAGNGTQYARISSVAPGTTFEHIATATNGWLAVAVGNRVGWVSGSYAQLIRR